MKPKSKVLLTTLLAGGLIAASVLGTMAFLTSRDAVENTFTFGQVKITLDEGDTDGSTPGAERDKANAYHLLPGQTYEKDPTVHIDPLSEDSWIFVRVENGIGDYEAPEEEGYRSISSQIAGEGWRPLEGKEGIFYRAYTRSDAGADYPLFQCFKISHTAEEIPGWGESRRKLLVTAYAVQREGFADPAQAWEAAFGE